MLPPDPVERARHRAWIEYASGTLAEIGGLYSAPDAAAFDAKRNSLIRRFERLEGEVKGPWFGGVEFGLVDAAFAPVFRYLDVFEQEAGLYLLPDLPRVAEWRARLASRSSVRAARRAAKACPADWLDSLTVRLEDLAGKRLLDNPRLRAAFQAIHREHFLPAVELERVYHDDAVTTQTGPGGMTTSSSSQPSIMALMLAQLDPQPGDRVLEIGAGTGYNAALLAYLVYLNWKLTLIVAFLVPSISWIMKVFSKRLYRLTQQGQQATDELAYVVEENVLAHRMVRLHGAEEAQGERFEQLSQRLNRLAVKSTIAQAATTPLTQMMASLALSVVVMIALWQSGEQGLTVGGFVAYITAMLMLIAPIRRLADMAALPLAELAGELLAPENLPQEGAQRGGQRVRGPCRAQAGRKCQGKPAPARHLSFQ